MSPQINCHLPSVPNWLYLELPLLGSLCLILRGIKVCLRWYIWDIRAAKNKKSYSKMKENR